MTVERYTEPNTRPDIQPGNSPRPAAPDCSRRGRVRLTLRAQLYDLGRNTVLAAREIDEVEIAISDDAYGGVIAANRALQRVLGQVTDFCDVESAKP